MEATQVIIVGCGPTGAILAASLGRLGIASVCLERNLGVNNDPRGIALDDDGIRALQSIGIYDKVFTDIGRCNGAFTFVDGVHHDLHRPPFLRLESTSAGATGHPLLIFHKQPNMEKHIREAFRATDNCQLREQCTLTNISEDEEWVYATYEDSSGDEHTVKAKFLVAADGKTGFTRKRYLEPKGILMEHTSQTTYEETWVAVNWHILPPTPDSHPGFPLWPLGYTAEQVYDAFFPQEFRFLCNPHRPTICSRFGPPADRLWRWEFLVRSGEDGSEMAKQEKLQDIVLPYLMHPGSRYGLDEDVTFPLDCIETLRSSPFKFLARSCNKWALDRVVLCGDAAHVFPPFGGQGIASGFRDACSLAWRLKMACQSDCSAYGHLFEGWYKERKQQLEVSLAATVYNGSIVTEANPLKILLRDTYMWAVQLVPSWKRQLQAGLEKPVCRYEYQPGMHFLPAMGGGVLLPQVYTRDWRGELRFSDDEIFAVGKQGLFQLLVILDSSIQLAEAYEELRYLARHPNDYLATSEATILVEDVDAELLANPPENVRLIRAASADEFAKSALCEGRPEPSRYDPFRISKETKGKRYLIVRPDRFVFAACSSLPELLDAIAQIEHVMNG
ncbi:hypothetical protein LTS10_002666 [Elasticomyces elasticus]|nr:hypothetical protein LTS10_002666 [Elasticomyces elasticus]